MPFPITFSVDASADGFADLRISVNGREQVVPIAIEEFTRSKPDPKVSADLVTLDETIRRAILLILQESIHKTTITETDFVARVNSGALNLVIDP
mgnify:CR=1 FL=1